MELISPVLEDPKASMEVVGIAALSLGLIFVGSAHGEVCVHFFGLILILLSHTPPTHDHY